MALFWITLTVLYLIDFGLTIPCTLENPDDNCKNNISCARQMLQTLNEHLSSWSNQSTFKFVRNMEKALERTYFSDQSVSLTEGAFVVHLYNTTQGFRGLPISANDSLAVSGDEPVMNRTLKVQLPQELLDGRENKTIVFCMITSMKYTRQRWNISRMVGLSIGHMTVSGLSDRINFSLSLPKNSEDKVPSCKYYDYKKQDFYDDGCSTYWEKEESLVTCSCNHLTYFAVLLISPSSVPKKDMEILTYLTLIGSSLSLIFLLVTIFLFIQQRCAISDTSVKVHMNLAVALLLMNVHFLPSHMVAELSSSAACTYIAVMLHYSLLATFTWTATEGFHLYLLLVRVFNIYIKRYLLKLCLVGWGFPAIVVTLILIISKSTYQRVVLSSEAKATSVYMCYISNDVVKAVTTIGFFSVVFVFNFIMWVVILHKILSLRTNNLALGLRHQATEDACSILCITCLLGITWGLVFFSFGHLTIPGLYLFCVINSLQGFFISLWFCIFKLQTSTNNQARTLKPPTCEATFSTSVV